MVVQINLALNPDTNEEVLITAAVKSKCLRCKECLVVVKGTKLLHHYRHEKNTECDGIKPEPVKELPEIVQPEIVEERVECIRVEVQPKIVEEKVECIRVEEDEHESVNTTNEYNPNEFNKLKLVKMLQDNKINVDEYYKKLQGIQC